MLSENLDHYQHNDQIIRSFREQYPGTIINKIRIKGLENLILQYERSDSLEFRYYLGFFLADRISQVNCRLDSLAQLDSLLTINLSQIQSYYVKQNHLPIIYQKRVLLILDSIEKNYLPEDSLESKLFKGKKFLTAIQQYLDKNSAVASQDSTIRRISDTLFRNFQRSFPGSFQEDLDLYRSLLSQYHVIETLDQKLEKGEQLTRNLKLLSTRYDSLKQMDSIVNVTFFEVVDYYSNFQPNIFFSEVETLQTRYKEFRQYRSIATCLILGDDLRAKLANFHSNIEPLKRYEVELQESFSCAKKKYQSTYKKLYLHEIVPYEEKIYQYKNLGSVSKKIETASQLLEGLHTCCMKFDLLLKQFDTINILLKENRNKYRITFPSVNRNELKELKLSFSTYKEMEKLDPKVDLGNKLIKQLSFLNFIHDTLLKLEDKVAQKAPEVKRMYKDVFNGLYHSEVRGLVRAADTFTSSAYAKSILDQGKSIWTRFRFLEDIHPELQQYHSDILVEYQKFLGLYRESKDNQLIYRKVRKAYAFFIKSIKQERKIETCIRKERALYFLLKKVNSLSGDDNSYIIKQLKEAKGAVELEKVFGIQF